MGSEMCIRDRTTAATRQFKGLAAELERVGRLRSRESSAVVRCAAVGVELEAGMVAACEPIAGTDTLRAVIPNGVSSSSSASRSIASPSEVLVKRVHWRAVLGLWALSLGACSTQTYDLVIANGRVMDPESGFDRVAHVGIVGSVRCV